MKQKNKEILNKLPTIRGDHPSIIKDIERRMGMTTGELRAETAERSKKYGLLRFLKDHP